MIRTTLFFVVSAAILVLVFLGYKSLLVAPPGTDGDLREEAEAIPAAQAARPEESINVGNSEVKAQIGGGEGMSLTIYDPKSKRATGDFRCKTWKKVPETDEEFIVEAPDISLLMPSGMIASIQADSGTLRLAGFQERRIEPRSGRLEGNARIVIDRESAADRAPASTRPEDVITIELAALEFDLEAGRLDSHEGVRLASDAFDISGVGLSLVWNTALNRLETLAIDRGESLTLYVDRNTMTLGGGEAPASGPASAPVVQPSSAPAAPPTKPPGPLTTYRCTLAENVVIDHIEGGRRAGGIAADTLELTFDVGGKAARVFERLRSDSQPTTTSSAPARRPKEERSQLRVAWDGELRLGPIVEEKPPHRPRRHFRATGRAVRLDLGDRSLTAGEFEYHDETGRIWLRPPAGNRLEITLGEQLHAYADEIYADRAKNSVKLIGDVDLQSKNRAGETGTAIKAELWAELRLRGDESPAESRPVSGGDLGGDLIEAMGGSSRLESATFVGGVLVSLGDQALAADRLDAWFRPGAGDEPMEQLLDRAEASGAVRLRGGLSTRPAWIDVLAAKWSRPFAPIGEPFDRAEQAIDAGWLELKFGLDEQKVLFPREIVARGDVVLKDRGREIVARARTLTARGSVGNQLDYAAIEGIDSAPARLRAQTFVVAGGRIEVMPSDEMVRVPGSAELSFRTERGLRGERSGRPQPVRVTCDRDLTVDNRRNIVVFAGNVNATSGIESLRGELLTLYLEDVASETPAGPPTLADWYGGLKAAVISAAENRIRDAAVASGRAPSSRPARRIAAFGDRRERSPSTRKEPLRLVARNASVLSEIFVPGDPQPLLHQSIAAPEMDIDIRKRVVRTTGETSLLNIDRRLPTEVADRPAESGQGAADMMGLPSAMVSRGPSQTAMRCTNSMIYAMGPSGPARRDSVVLDGNVLFRHAAGREMSNLAAMFPREAGSDEFLKRLGGRMTGLACSRMECTFETGGSSVVGGLNAAQPSMRLAFLGARGGVSLVDSQDATRREVAAEQIEFERERAVIRILGAPTADAQLTTLDLKAGTSGRVDSPVIIFDLKSNTVTAEKLTGESIR